MPRPKQTYNSVGGDVEKHIINIMIVHDFDKSGVNTRCLLADLI